METIVVNPSVYLAITRGQRSHLIIDESEKYLINAEIILQSSDQDKMGNPVAACICSVNGITTSEEEVGLKKNHSIISVSVVRLVAEPSVLIF